MDEYSDEKYYTDRPLPRGNVTEQTPAKEQVNKMVSIIEEAQRGLKWLLEGKFFNFDNPPAQPESEPETAPEMEVKEQDNIPEKIVELWKICRRTQWSPTRNRDFYNQALYASQCEDDVEQIAPFFAYTPVYADMSMAQLRSYFTLRKRWRNGEYPQDISLSYLFVYIYEILMHVGVLLSEEGLTMLERIRDNYRDFDPRVEKYLKVWMRDYVVFYGLIYRAKEYFAVEAAEDAAAEALYDLDETDDETLFDSIAAFSTYHIKDSRLYKRHPEMVTTVCARVIRATAPILEKRYNLSIDRIYLGDLKEVPQQMFASAVFYRRYPYRKRFYPVTENRSYSCLKGVWKLEMYCSVIAGGKRGGPAGELLRETDRQLRIGMKGEPRLMQRMKDPTLEAAIQRVVDQYREEKRQEELAAEREAARLATLRAREEVEVDLSRLDRIRSDADVVREALLTDDDRAEVAKPTKPTVAAPTKQATPAKTTPTPTPVATVGDETTTFTERERRFLHLLIEGGDWANYLRDIRVPVGVMVDSINEKMMEELQDIAIADRGNGPEVIDDYLDDVIRRI